MPIVLLVLELWLSFYGELMGKSGRWPSTIQQKSRDWIDYKNPTMLLCYPTVLCQVMTWKYPNISHGVIYVTVFD